MKILISGGHLTPALAFIDYVTTTQNDIKIVFVGRLYSQDKLKQPAQEKPEIERRSIPFIPFTAVRSSRQLTWLQKIFFPFRFINSIFRALQILNREKPDVFLSFGGYIAVPLAIATWLKNIPIVTHEQTSSSGFANQLIARLAARVAISFPQSASYFPKHKVRVTGNPLRPDVLEVSQVKPSWLTHQPQLPILLVTGGNQGSSIINTVVKQALPILTEHWFVIHLCGNPHTQNNYQAELEAAQQKLSPQQQKNYIVKNWVSGEELAWIYTHTHLAVSRAGANTVAELTARNIPTLYIPLPNAHHNEQTKNIQPLVQKQAAMTIDQSQLNAESLISNLLELDANHELIKRQLNLISPQTDGSQKLFGVISQVVPANAQ